MGRALSFPSNGATLQASDTQVTRSLDEVIYFQVTSQGQQGEGQSSLWEDDIPKGQVSQQKIVTYTKDGGL